MKDMAVKAGYKVLGINCDSEEADFEIDSAATSTEETGMPVYPPARRKLLENGIGVGGNDLGVNSHHAHRMTEAEYNYYDLIICMDSNNLRNLRRIIGEDTENKVRLLLDYTDRTGAEVADPWYTGNFDATWRDVVEGCEGILKSLTTGV